MSDHEADKNSSSESEKDSKSKPEEKKGKKVAVEPMEVGEGGDKYDSDGKTVVKLKKKENEALESELSAEMIQTHLAVRLYLALVWVVATGIMVWYTTEIAGQYISALQTPSSAINIDDPIPLPMPTVVVCNWNQDVLAVNTTPSGTCPECFLTFEYCYNYNATTAAASDCTGEWTHTPIFTSAGLFDCYSYNFDPKTIAQSNSTGYSGSLATVWSVIPLNASIENRAGCQATFGFISPEQNESTITPEQIYNEVNFASLGLDTFYAFKLVLTEHLELKNTSDPNYNKTRFDVSSSLTTILVPPSATVGYVGISFSYQTLSKEEDTFSIGYSLLNLFGDFAGMIGTLLGIDTVKVASGIPVLYLAAKWRSLGEIEDHFN